MEKVLYPTKEYRTVPDSERSCGHRSDTKHDDHYVRLIPIDSRLLTNTEQHDVVQLKLATYWSVTVFEEYMQAMDNVIYFSVQQYLLLL